MSRKILISTAYLPPVEYFSQIFKTDDLLIEKEENYLKQTFRNRCCILSAYGTQILSVPVYLGSLHKTPIKDIRIDYSKRWQQVHLRAIIASYGSSPYFEFYFENIEKIISENHEFLLDLNMELLNSLLEILKVKKEVRYSSHFEPVCENPNDFRYNISPKSENLFPYKRYTQVFDTGKGFVPHLSIIDLIFNMGPESPGFL